ncbi:MAG: aminotransferase class V-fold PLP-dependent enzyme [Nitrospira sp.]
MRYFNYAGFTPARAEAVEEMQAVSDEFGTQLFSQSGIAWYRTQLVNTRAKVARLLHVNDGEASETLAFTQNSTTACRFVVSSLDLHRGDVVVTSDQEHLSTWQTLEDLRQRGVELVVIPVSSEERFLTQLEDVCRKRTVKLITVSHVAHTDGRILPVHQVGEIAGKRNTILMIDGAQAVGHIPVDLSALDADCYFFSGHKWCAGPMGTGALFITKRDEPRLTRRASGLSETGSAQEYFELGTQNIGLIAGLGRACEMKQQELPTMVNLASLRTLFRGCLSRMNGVETVEWDGPHAPGILSFRLHNPAFNATRIAEHLEVKYDIAIKPLRSLEFSQMLRVSWSVSTDVQDVLFLAEKLGEALAEC